MECNLLAAKTDQDGGDNWLPLWMHLKDTAGIMDLLARRWLPDTERRLLWPDGSDDGGLYQMCKFLGYSHDIGKATAGFQSKILTLLPEIREKIARQGITVSEKSIENVNHALAGEIILLELNCNKSVSAVIGAHHGKPQEESDADKEYQLFNNGNSFFGKQEKEWTLIWESMLKYALDESGYSSVDDLPKLNMKQQILFSGLLIMADWIASNTRYFPLISIDETGSEKMYPRRIEGAWNKLSLPDYWEAGGFGMDDELFKERFGFEPNSVQKAMMDIVENADEPGIIILEAQMGIGKTEAALACAEILAQKYGCGGVFFGMPTQATSNGLFPRFMEWAEGQSEDLKLSIKLAHGAAELNEDYKSLFDGTSNVDDPDTGLIVHSWFEGRKQAMLSNFVIGTVDQLLMMSLKRKHVMLRHLGMAGKIVIIDEAHAYDAYMGVYLESALSWLGAYKVPVIILSATLPGDRREKFIAAYLNKLSLENNDIKKQLGYPLITWTDAGKEDCEIVGTDSAKRNVAISVIDDSRIIGIISDAVADGGCISVILNTVKRAQKIAKMVHNTIQDTKVILFHSQFVMTDRAEIEAKLIDTLGKHSKKEQRSRTVVIGTQVLEQSLDIDADVMITDLCPMDLLLQRIGRLQRHRSHDDIRPGSLKKATCFVVTPSDGSFEEGSEVIYGKYLMMRTKALLTEKIVIPDDIPLLVQSVYNDEYLVDVNENEYLSAKEECSLKIRKKEGKASGYCMKSPNSNFGTLHKWISQVDTELSDATAQATVRDGNPSVEAIVLVKNGDVISFLPWQNNGATVRNDIIPSKEEALQISRQKVKLPGVFCTDHSVNGTIDELEHITEKYFEEWVYSPMLKGELVLLLDKDLKGELNGYRISYSRENGLSYEKKESD